MGRIVSRTACPKCQEQGKDRGGDNLCMYEDNSAYCFSCGYFETSTGANGMQEIVTLPRVINNSENGWRTRAISRDVMDRFSVFRVASDETVAKEDGTHDYKPTATLLFPYHDVGTGELIGYKTRDLSVEKKHGIRWHGDAQRMSLFGINSQPKHATTVVLVEGEPDALALATVNKDVAVYAIPGAEHTEKVIKRAFPLLNTYKRIVLLLDNDEPGKRATEKALSILPKSKLFVANLPANYKDVGEMVQAGLTTEVNQLVKNAKQVMPPAIVDDYDLLKEYHDAYNGIDGKAGISYGFRSLDEASGGMHGGELITIVAGTGSGKDLPLHAHILTANKGLVTVADLVVGDCVFGANGKPVEVVGLSPVWYDQQQYEVWFDDGTFVECGANHLWTVQSLSGAKTNRRKPQTVSTQELLKQGIVSAHGRKMHSVQLSKALVFPDANLPLDSYTLGVWLGDGTTVEGAITTPDADIIERITERTGYFVSSVSHKENNKASTYRFKGLKDALRECGVLGHKHIPDVYKTASYEQRLELLRGCLDSDGYAGKEVEYCSILPRLANDVAQLARGLGYKAVVRENAAYLNGRYISQRYRVYIKPTDDKLFWVARKRQAVQVKTQNCNLVKYITNILPTSVKPSRCLQVANADGLFLAGGYDVTVTHNSTFTEKLSLNVAEQGYNVFFCPLEMMPREVIKKMVQHKSGIPVARPDFKRNDFTDKKLKGVAETIVERIKFMSHFGGMDIDSFLANCEAAIAMYEVKVIVVDHLTALVTASAGGNNVFASDNITSRLKEFALKHDVTIIAISHVSRDSGYDVENKVPQLKHLRGGNGVAQYSDFVIGLGRKRSEKTTDIETIKLHRMVGEHRAFKLIYQNYTLLELVEDAEADVEGVEEKYVPEFDSAVVEVAAEPVVASVGEDDVFTPSAYGSLSIGSARTF